MRFRLLVPLLALGLNGCAAVAIRAAEHARTADPAQMFQHADANGDGRVTRQQFADAQGRMFARLDRDGDGYLTSADASRGRRFGRGGGEGGGAASALRAMDRDGNGRISRDEFVAGTMRMFERADTNRDGVVDTQEIAAFRAAVAARRGQ